MCSYFVMIVVVVVFGCDDVFVLEFVFVLV